MASCITQQWSGYAPQVRLTVVQSSETETQATLAWTLEYVAHGYAAETSTPRAYTVTINGSVPPGGSGSYNIGGITGTKTIASGSVPINKSTAAINVPFSVSFAFNLTWSNVYGGTKNASGSISVKEKASYTISYNTNGGTGTLDAQKKWHGTDLVLWSTKPTKSGYTFVGWGTSDTDTSPDWSAGGKYTANSDRTLYAIWSKKITLSYNANGGSGAPGTQSVTVYNAATSSVFTLSNTKPTRNNYNFLGWSTSSSATSASHSAGGSFTVNADTTLYAVWELAWLKPVIYNLAASRYIDYVKTNTVLEAQNGSIVADVITTTGEAVYLYIDPIGHQTFYTIVDSVYYEVTYNDTNARVVFDWKTTYDVTSISIAWSSISGNGSTSITASGKSGAVNMIIGNYALNPETAYTITVTVADSNGSNVSSTTLPGLVFPIDVYKKGSGIAFGKAAELAGTAEFAWDAKFNKPVYGTVRGLDKLPQMPESANANDYMSPSCWAVYTNARAATIANLPVPVAGCLEVISSVGAGIHPASHSYIRQRYIPFHSSYPVYERDIIRGADNVWTYDDWWASSLTPTAANKVYHEQKVLWSGTWNMNASQTVPLSEGISKQATGIQLVFSLYRNGAAEDVSINSFFVSKKEVELLPGAPHTFIMGINSGFSNIGAKYLKIYDTSIEGNATNTESGTNSGISFQNSSYVLRYVIGV